ncbi:hypothetical protein TI39_contig367g00016 [Zymoseptoria brevis]|uniref:Uncharacterized protein n=1 Tax=Zymoseptoria brevis TaxID=1047168 RepID=A0A0F4GPT3_9PEZI|nr:hypothetical protein TI39_contig367g00016 [Zymoseptoria brevis]
MDQVTMETEKAPERAQRLRQASDSTVLAHERTQGSLPTRIDLHSAVLSRASEPTLCSPSSENGKSGCQSSLLLELPLELFEKIIRTIRYAKDKQEEQRHSELATTRAFHALVRTCKPLHRIVLPYLYETVQIAPGHDFPWKIPARIAATKRLVLRHLTVHTYCPLENMVIFINELGTLQHKGLEKLQITFRETAAMKYSRYTELRDTELGVAPAISSSSKHRFRVGYGEIWGRVMLTGLNGLMELQRPDVWQLDCVLGEALLSARDAEELEWDTAAKAMLIDFGDALANLFGGEADEGA